MKNIFLVFLFSFELATAQDLPYRQIPDYPAEYTAATVAARMVDGLGFRYYWATEGMRAEDINFSPDGDGRTSLETLVHIYDLTNVLLSAVNKKVTESGLPKPELPFTELRKLTLENLKAASEKLKASTEQELNDYKIIFKNGDKITEYPFWNQLNGPIADALWHVGQIVSFRRSSGNPFNPKVNVLTGRVRE
jgi:hypothetical protein